jgi:hypothetical protein
MMRLEAYENRGAVWKTVVYDFDRCADIAKHIARNPYAWPGGYPRFAITDDGGALCPKCCRAEFGLIARSLPGDGWHVVAHDINYEDNSLYCDHCNNQIESAYGDD